MKEETRVTPPYHHNPAHVARRWPVWGWSVESGVELAGRDDGELEAMVVRRIPRSTGPIFPGSRPA